MSGHKVVSILDFHKEAYIHGGPVRRRKQTGISRYMTKGIVSPPATTHDITEYVVGNCSTFKLRSRINTTGKDTIRRNSFKNMSKDGDDSEKDTFDADAMMMAAARGENISSIIAAEDTRKRKRSKQSQDGSSPPVLLWKQSHCYIKSVTPLMTVDGELDLETQKRDDEKREKEELIKAINITMNGMDGRLGMLGLANATSLTSPDTPNNDGNVKGNADGENKFGEIVGGVAAHIDPNDPRIKETHVNGFVIHYFTPDKKGKLVSEMTSTAKRLIEAAAGSLPSSSIVQYEKRIAAVNSDISPPLRHRLFVCHSQHDQDEWCLVYRSVLLNYWHERLENSIVREPEIFQFQQFAMGRSDSNTAYGVVQCVLSTGSLFIVPRGSKAQFENDNTVTTKKMPIGALKNVIIEKSRNAVSITGGSELNKYSLSFFSPAESCEFVLELQRIWEMGSPAAASGAFPYTNL